MVDCGCEAWKTGIAQINAALFHWQNHGNSYSGGSYIFCPWCGVKILGEGGVATDAIIREKK